MNKQDMEQKLAQRKDVFPLAIWSRSALEVPMQAHSDKKAALHWQQMPSDPAQCAHALFAQLRAFDAFGVVQIWVETPHSDSAWEGVHDRLRRAETAGR